MSRATGKILARTRWQAHSEIVAPRPSPAPRGAVLAQAQVGPGVAGSQCWSSEWILRTVQLLAHLEHAGHPQRAVKLAREGQHARGRERDVQLDLAPGWDVLVDAERGDRDVVQGADVV